LRVAKHWPCPRSSADMSIRSRNLAQTFNARVPGELENEEALHRRRR
jgi:hypothetical protein